MSLEPAKPEQNVLHGIGWMLLTSTLFVCVTGIVRHLGSALPAVEAAFLRYLFGVIMISPVFIPLFKRPPSAANMKIYAIRGVVHGFAVMLWFFAMARIPIGEVTAIGYCTPIFVTIGAALFLGEKLQIRRILAVAMGFMGALIILRPGFQELKLGQLAQFAATPLFATSFIMAKKMTDKTDPALIVAMLSLFCTIVLLPGAMMQWRTPSQEEIFWLTLTALFATLGHYTLTRAFKAAPITVTQPFSFLQLVFAVLMGIFIFGEPLDIYVLIGGAVIVGAATYISHRETIAARKQSTPPVASTKV